VVKNQIHEKYNGEDVINPAETRKILIPHTGFPGDQIEKCRSTETTREYYLCVAESHVPNVCSKKT
jgi:hypothetical protein